ncbi:MAG TPA: imidazolonepropionase [Mycobacteriales bacterium]|nr:imidazolonepropionase [Mycobacteriales bacterium]
MRSLVVEGIGRLVTWGDPPVVRDAALVCEDGVVAWTGPAARAPAADQRLDAGGGCVVPGFVDAHTHLVFAGDRSAEFEARLAGRPYAAGGIRTTVASTRAASTEELLASASRLAAEALRSGTTTIEVKSGYGLDVATERRLLDVAAQLTPHRTFLGAHVVPDGADRAEYVDLVCGQMLDAVADVATAVDVFCEDGAFDGEESHAVLEAGRDRGLDLHVHANQLGPGPGARLAAELGAASADHCTHLSDDDVGALVDASVVTVLVPGAEFSTRSAYAPARRLLDAGAVVALATDCNPGTSFTTSLPFVVALACRELAMTPGEALRAVTAGGAAALRRDDVGHLRVGARADLVVLDAPSEVFLAYRPGVDLVRSVVRGGEVVR